MTKATTTFGLRAFPGYTFRVNEAYSYTDDQGIRQVVLDVQQPSGMWVQFGREAEPMLRPLVVPAPGNKK